MNAIERAILTATYSNPGTIGNSQYDQDHMRVLALRHIASGAHAKRSGEAIKVGGMRGIFTVRKGA